MDGGTGQVLYNRDDILDNSNALTGLIRRIHARILQHLVQSWYYLVLEGLQDLREVEEERASLLD